MTDEIRCPKCGARNGPDAEWCGQCFTTFRAEPIAPPPPPSSPAPPVSPTALPPPSDDGLGRSDVPPPSTQPSAPAPASEGIARPDGGGLRSGGGRFRQGDEGLEWVCDVCQEWNTIERVTCVVCSSPFGTSREASAPARPDVASGVLVASTLVLPGAGHWLLDLRGAAVLRAFLAVVWGLGGLSLWVQASNSGQPVLPAIPLLLGWLVVAAGSVNDVLVEAGGRGQRVLDGRFLLWLTIGVVGGTFAAVLIGVMSAVR